MAVTPNYGWPIPVATDYVKDGWDAIADLGNAIDTTLAGFGSGDLVLTKVQTIGSGVSSVAVTDAFSTTYDAYFLVVSGGTPSTYIDLELQLGATTSAYYRAGIGMQYSGGSAFASSQSNQSRWNVLGYGSSDGMAMQVLLINPYLSKPTVMSANMAQINTGGGAIFSTGYQNSTTSFTGFTIFASGGTMTGGTIAVYGYVKA